MLSFKKLSPNEIKRITDSAEFDKEMIESTLDNIYENSDEDFFGAISESDGCLLVRIFDFGRYSFIYPVPIKEEYDIEAAVLKIIDYAILEELSPIFTDVPKEDLVLFTSLFRHLEIDACDPYGNYTVRLKNECELLSSFPCVKAELCDCTLKNDITLKEIDERDCEAYARLCRDPENNKYWGYDYREDESDAKESYFLEVAKDELKRAVAIILGVYEGGRLVGEVSIYGFDYQGGAKCAVRILPEHQGKGLAKDSINLLKTAAKKISLTNLIFECMCENTASYNLLSKVVNYKNTENGKYTFTFSLFDEE